MDIKCVRCGEPWDAYGVAHGDMLPWEAALFKRGAGCPSCEGKSNGWEPQTIDDVENGDGDPMERIAAHENGAAIAWKRPADPVHWTCDGCGVEVVTDLDTNELEYRVPFGAKCRQWYASHRFDRGAPEKEPAHVFGEWKVCEFCLDRCADCGTEISTHLEFGDPYADGYAFPQPGSYTDSVCTDCFEQYCSECESRECSCGSCLAADDDDAD
jgi:hypothetical protein